MYIIDTNIFLELLLNQANAASVREFLSKTDPASLSLTDFSLHSIGVFLFREHQYDLSGLWRIYLAEGNQGPVTLPE